MAALTKYHRLGDLNNRNLLSQSPGDWKFKIKESASLVSSEASPQRLADAHLLTVTPPCPQIPGVSHCVQVFLKGHLSDWIRARPTHINLT